MSTYPTEGERTVDFKYWNVKPNGEPPRSSPEIGFGYTVNTRWYTELTAEFFRFSPGSNHLSAIEWQNDFMLTQGQYRSTSLSIPTSSTPRTAPARSVSSSARCCRPRSAAPSST
ncbi:MAG: hypothetical protein JWR65_4103 [Massilia sp.]|nr:hypothetical protein [Massilia sp.]